MDAVGRSMLTGVGRENSPGMVVRYPALRPGRVRVALCGAAAHGRYDARMARAPPPHYGTHLSVRGSRGRRGDPAAGATYRRHQRRAGRAAMVARRPGRPDHGRFARG